MDQCSGGVSTADYYSKLLHFFLFDLMFKQSMNVVFVLHLAIKSYKYFLK